jgi:hypothetical protein
LREKEYEDEAKTNFCNIGRNPGGGYCGGAEQRPGTIERSRS